MGHSQTYDAIVLKTYDVGEADRFCILITRERGRLAVRAKAVRKTTSKMGAGLLALRRITVELHEGRAGFIVTTLHKSESFQCSAMSAFNASQQGMKILLALLHDEEAVPEIFDATCAFLEGCKNDRAPLLQFIIRLLYLSGLLPDPKEQSIKWNVSREGTQFLTTCTLNSWNEVKKPPTEDTQRIQMRCEELLRIHLTHPITNIWDAQTEERAMSF